MAPRTTSKLFLPLFTAVFFVFVFSIIGLFLLRYHSLIRLKESRAETNSYKIYSIINSNFNYTEQLLIFMGKKISNNNKEKDLEYIHKTFVDTTKIELSRDNIFSWSRFDWVDKDNQQTVNTMTGIELQNPQDMSLRSYSKEAQLDPWRLKFAPPLMGYPSHIYVIPAGVGIANQYKKYLGSITVGIDINKLTNKINSDLELGDNFILIDSTSLDFIVGSIDLMLKKDHQDIERLFKKIKLQHLAPEGYLKDPIEFENTQYVYSFDMQKYPYIILTGYDKKFFWQEFYSLFVPTFTLLAFITIMIEVLLLMLWKKNKLN
ncbi:MAG: hypothetical protein EXR06_01165 [Rickettsiales bacterium]|nr:hypothetical protein [Rickettsiales bacterium]